MGKLVAVRHTGINQTDYSQAAAGPGELALIHAAERLFAQHGAAGVSLRQVNLEAGHRNMSAAHYHFGSRDGLVRAVLANRMPLIDRRRSELLARAPSAGQEHDLRFYLEAYVLPLAEQLRPRPEGNHYLRFLLQYRSLPIDFDLLQDLTPSAFAMSGAISGLLSYLPARILQARHINVVSMIISTLANAEGLLSDGELDAADVPLIAANLVDTATAALTAPISAETLKTLRG